MPRKEKVTFPRARVPNYSVSNCLRKGTGIFYDEELINAIVFLRHNEDSCPTLPKNKDKLFTRSGISFERENLLSNIKLRKIEKQFKLKLTTLVIWECEFEAMLKQEKNRDFSEKIKPNLIYFSRLNARESLIGGYRTVFNHR